MLASVRRAPLRAQCLHLSAGSSVSRPLSIASVARPALRVSPLAAASALSARAFSSSLPARSSTPPPSSSTASSPPFAPDAGPPPESTSAAADLSTLPSSVDPTHASHLSHVLSDTTTPLQYGDLAELGLCKGWFVGSAQKLLEVVNVSTGLPWWATIALTVAGLRLALFPLLGNILGNNARLQAINPLVKERMDALKAAQKEGDMASAQLHLDDVRQLLRKHNAKPLLGLVLPLAQFPLFISFYYGLNGMCELPVAQLKDGGALWFPDLTATDYGLPLLSAAAIWAVLRVGMDGSGTTGNATLNKYKPLMLVAIPTLVGFTSMWFPSAVLIYWLTTNTFSVAQAYALRLPALRTYFGMPELKPPEGAQASLAEAWGEVRKWWVNSMAEARAEQDRKAHQKLKVEEALRARLQATSKAKLGPTTPLYEPRTPSPSSSTSPSIPASSPTAAPNQPVQDALAERKRRVEEARLQRMRRSAKRQSRY